MIYLTAEQAADMGFTPSEKVAIVTDAELAEITRKAFS